MKLDKKKALASKVFGVGKERIIFVEPRLGEIKEAITKEDIRNLQADDAIIIKEMKGKKARGKNNQKKKSAGNIRQNVRKRKREYITITRKLRRYTAELKKKKIITQDKFIDINKKIKNRNFKNKNQLKEYLEQK